MSNIDAGYVLVGSEDIGITTNTVKNPYLSHGTFRRSDNIKEIISQYKKLYTITICDNATDVEQHIYREYLTFEEYESIRNKLIVRQVPFTMLKNLQIKDLLINLRPSDLPSVYIDINDKIVSLDHNQPNILAISAIHINNNSMMSYLKLYTGVSSVSSLTQLMIINDLFGAVTTELAKKNRQQIINSLTETLYWQLEYNCHLNITLHFYNRGFNLSLVQRLEDKNVKDIISRLLTNDDTNDHDDYLCNILRKKAYVDASSSVIYKKFQLYKITSGRTDEILSVNEFNDILNACINRKEMYLLLCNMLITKDFCHLVVNNANALIALKTAQTGHDRSLLAKYTPIFAHLFSYAWLSMYLEESIKKTYISNTDRCVFTIDVATELPYFPCVASNPHTSPYLSILVGKDVLEASDNNLGVPNYYKEGHMMGVCNREEFNKRMNIFISGNENLNYLIDIDWSTIAITGSIIAACLPRFNPLMLNFMTDNIDMNAYFNEYYDGSDVDVMCNKEDNFEFVKVANDFANKINENIKKLNNIQDDQTYVTITPIKTAVIMINQEFIKQHIIPHTDMSYVDIVLNIHDIKVKKLFYGWYVKQKLLDNNNYISSDLFKDEKYDSYFELCDIENVLIVIIDYNSYNKKEDDKNTAPNIDNTFVKEEDIDNEEEYDPDDIESNNVCVNEINVNKCLLVINENFKYRIESLYLKRKFELFRIKHKEFFATVARFHLPIVRSYITKDNVYMLPSCITACHTMMNIDYKYFAGAKDPIEIINKYRSRGFGTYLNYKEKMRMIEYSNLASKWKELYKLRPNNQNSINSFFGNIDISSDFYKPSHVLSGMQTVYNTHGADSAIKVTEQNINDIYKRIYGGVYENLTGVQKIVHCVNCINDSGFVVKLRKWLIDGCYEQPVQPAQ
jgi:hypothetical protein